MEGVLQPIVRFESPFAMYSTDEHRSDICQYIISNLEKPPRMHGLLDVILRHTLWIPCGEEHIEQLLSIAFRVLGELQKNKKIFVSHETNVVEISGDEHQDCTHIQ